MLHTQTNIETSFVKQCYQPEVDLLEAHTAVDTVFRQRKVVNQRLPLIPTVHLQHNKNTNLLNCPFYFVIDSTYNSTVDTWLRKKVQYEIYVTKYDTRIKMRSYVYNNIDLCVIKKCNEYIY